MSTIKISSNEKNSKKYTKLLIKSKQNGRKYEKVFKKLTNLCFVCIIYVEYFYLLWIVIMKNRWNTYEELHNKFNEALGRRIISHHHRGRRVEKVYNLAYHFSNGWVHF
jgi:hypothetical protein